MLIYFFVILGIIFPSGKTFKQKREYSTYTHHQLLAEVCFTNHAVIIQIGSAHSLQYRYNSKKK